MYSLPTNALFLLRKHAIMLISFLVFSGLNLFYMKAQNMTLLLVNYEPFIMNLDFDYKNISCHYVVENDALPSAENRNFIPRPNSIFFHETTCRGGLISRQACTIESAARANPTKEIYVMFSAPVSYVVFQKSSIAKLRRFHNVRFARVHITDYAKYTPLEAMLAKKPFKKSLWPIQHTSDVLRFVTLYKWGGVYLDTDMLVVKSLTPLGPNWVGKEDNVLVANGAIALSMDPLGRKLIKAILRELKTTFMPDQWLHNGPGLITRILVKLCNSTNIAEWSNTTCRGFSVYGPQYLYPVFYPMNKLYFEPGGLWNIDKAYTHHLWNKLSWHLRIEKDSPYEKMAKKFCPTIYQMYGEEFGS